MGESQGQTQARRYTRQAVNTLQGAQGALLIDPNFLIGRDLGYELATDPFSWNPMAIRSAKDNVTTGAYGPYGGELNRIDEEATAAQGFRSGTTNNQKRHAAMDLGNTISMGHRQIDTAAALQRPQDIMNAINAQLPILQTQFQFPRDIANVYSGAATNPIWAQPSPAQGIGQGLGGILGMGLAPGGFMGAGGGKL